MFCLLDTLATLGPAPRVQLLPESNPEGFFKMTYLEGYWELEGILADLGFSAKVHVWKIFVLKKKIICVREICVCFILSLS